MTCTWGRRLRKQNTKVYNSNKIETGCQACPPQKLLLILTFLATQNILKATTVADKAVK